MLHCLLGSEEGKNGVGVQVTKGGKQRGGQEGGERGKQKKEEKKGILERHGTCLQVSQQIQLKRPLIRAKLFWA